VICAGATTAYLNLAVHVVDRLAGHDLAVATAKALSIDLHGESQRPYFLFIAPRDHGDAKVLELQGWIENNYARAIDISDMVEVGGMSVRNLSRRFHAATGLSPRQYLRRVRIEAAKRGCSRVRSRPSNASRQPSAIATPAPLSAHSAP
jgi:transcriptional regulator GlxA family with amidase domain